MASNARPGGAIAARPPKKAPLGWLVPVAILLLVLIIAAVTLILLNANDNGDDPGLDVTDDPQALVITTPEAATS